ncbi:multidrug resistance protein, MATE family [Solilutibacter tolerans]|uniref:Multidrug resistance protein, MATE family n=2 Tax=Solilutibacter tolerans TaxID=1604334 RepID=A0A1N6SBP4_9GAMM|nr:MATE family efflux transporter [Lysobacter tolerans]SIQ38471.1 multidrug resistance protein, MATE family [Lysobacter tolerans]
MRQELARTARLAAPLAAGHLATGMIGLVDSLVAGRHGTATLAAVSVGTAMFWLPMMIPMGTLMALPPSISQMDGAGRRHEIAPLFRQALWLAAALGVVLFGLMSLFPLALDVIGIAPDIRPGAAAFIHGIRWGVPALTLYLAMRYLCDGLHWSLPTMLFGLGGLLVLAPLGWAMAFGRWGFPEMGAGGLGYASAAMMWAQAVGFTIYLATAKRFTDLHLFGRFDLPAKAALGSLLKTGLPIGVTVAMEGSLFIVTALLIGRLGEVPAAAHQIAINVASLCFMIPFGIAEATTVRVGNALGRGDRSQLLRAAKAGLLLVLGTQFLSGVLMIFGHDFIASRYTADVAVATLAGSLLLYAAAFQFPDGIQVLSAGALRGLKDTRVPMLLAALAYWGIGMPLGAGLGLGLGWGPKGMWLGLIAGLCCAAFLLARRFLSSARRIPMSEQGDASGS